MQFQSTLPARGATTLGVNWWELIDYFNPRSPHGERQNPQNAIAMLKIFQSTLPARGATFWASAWRNRQCNFNPRSPHGERQGVMVVVKELQDISIHAPRTGSDRTVCWTSTARALFQSTLPARGATRGLPLMKHLPLQFQSTLPARGATADARRKVLDKKFQSTLPARGATDTAILGMMTPPQFQSTLPARGATSGKLCGM